MTITEIANDYYNSPRTKEDYQRHRDNLVQYLQDNYKWNKEQAEVVESFVFEQYHSCFSDVIWYTDEYAQFIQRFLSHQTPKG